MPRTFRLTTAAVGIAVLTGCNTAAPQAAPVANSGQQTHASACLRDNEADSLRTAAMDPATWQRSSSFATS